MSTVTDIASDTASSTASDSSPDGDLLPPYDDLWRGTPTLNGQGWMHENDETTLAFVTHAAKHSSKEHPAFEVAAAFGQTSILALDQGATMIANDIDPRHLDILKQRILKPEHIHRLTLLPGSFPQICLAEPSPIPYGSLSSICISNLFHLFTGDEIDLSFTVAYDLLMPGGMIYVVAASVMVRTYPAMEAKYESNLISGMKYPGLLYLQSLVYDDFDHIKETLTEDIRITTEQAREQVPHRNLWLRTEDLVQAATDAGFTIIRSNYYPYNCAVVKLDGRERVHLVAKKPDYNEAR